MNRISPAKNHKRIFVIAGLAAMLMATTPLSPINAFVSSAEAAPVVAVQGFADLVEEVSPAVVSILVSSKGEPQRMGARDWEQIPERFRRFFGPGLGGKRQARPMNSQGSGFFISADGYVVTNNHVVEKATDIKVRLRDGSEAPATIVGTDPKTDLALLKVESDELRPFVNLSDSEARVGDWVVAVGNPFGLGGTVTAGIVSARGRDIGAGPYDDFIQIDASVNKGNSGGPAFALDGSVIGVNTAIFSPSGGNVGIAFAIPASTVKHVVDQLRTSGTVSRGWLGVAVQPVTDDIAQSLGLEAAAGALVANVVADSPAEAAGLRVGDAIVSVDSEKMDDHRELVRQIGGLVPGQTVQLGVWRGDRKIEVDLKLAAQPDTPRMAALDHAPERPMSDRVALGLSLMPDADGLRVAAIDPEGPAAEAGLREGQIILQAGGYEMRGVADLRDAIETARSRGRKSVLLLVADEEGNRPRFVPVPLKAA